MSSELMSRRKFLVGAGAVVGAASISGLVLAERPSNARAATQLPALPWPYVQLDPDAVGRRSYEIYYTRACAEGSWYSVVEALAPTFPDTWGALPENLFKFGVGGVNSWGTICGTLNGSCAAIAATGADSSLEDALMQYYTETPLPTNGVDKAVRAGWVPAAGPTPVPENVPTSTAHSPLCHASLSQWLLTAGDGGADTKVNTMGGSGMLDRCAKLCYDLSYKTVTLLNAYFADGTKPTVVLDPSVAACKACHSVNVIGKQGCNQCHDQTVTHTSGD